MKWKQVYEPLKRTLTRVKNASKCDKQKATRLMKIKEQEKYQARDPKVNRDGRKEEPSVVRRLWWKWSWTVSGCHIKKCTGESWWTDEKRREWWRNGVVEWTQRGLLTLRKWVKTVMCSFVCRFSLVNGKGSQVDDTNVSKKRWTSVWKSAWYRMNRRVLRQNAA